MSGGRINVTLSNRDRKALGLPPSGHLAITTHAVLAAARRAEARKLRDAGLTFREIGERLGVSKQRVHQMIAHSPSAGLRQQP